MVAIIIQSEFSSGETWDYNRNPKSLSVLFSDEVSLLIVTLAPFKAKRELH